MDDVPKNDFLDGASSVCENPNIFQGGSVHEESHLIYYNDSKLTYCFGVGDLYYLSKQGINPYTTLPLTATFLDWLSKFLQTDTYIQWLSELQTEDVKEELSFNQKKDIIDEIIKQGLFFSDNSSKGTTDPYIDVDSFLKLIKENSDYSLLPDEVNLSSNDSIINYLYNNINTFIPLNENRYSVIYMIVKYAYNKELIENEEELIENKEELKKNKEFAESWNETFEDLIGNLYSINVTDRIFRKIKRNNELAKYHINLFLEAVERGRMDILEIMKPYLTNKMVKEIFMLSARTNHLEVLKWLNKNFNITDEEAKSENNYAFRWAASKGNLEVLKWLKDTFNMTEKDAKTYDNEPFKLAARHGYLEVLKWLKLYFNITKQDAKSDNNFAFREAAKYGHLDILKWLKDNYNITEKDTLSDADAAFLKSFNKLYR